MPSKEQSRTALNGLIKRYNENKSDKNFVSNEKQIQQALIVPFVRDALGWNVDDPSEFKVESPAKGKKVDILICLNGVTQFIIEVKSLTQDIVDNTDFYKQAMSYANSKDKTFAILTNFRYFVILRCDVEVDNPLKAAVQIIDIETLKDSDFDLLYNFSKNVWIESGEQNPLYSKLANYKRRAKVDARLLDNLKSWRQAVINNVKSHSRHNKFDFSNEKERYEVEEEIQRFLDRLIFICYAEDREFADAELKPMLEQKKDKYFSSSSWLLSKIRELFQRYWKDYNSDLFRRGKCDEFFIDDGVLVDILTDLRKPKQELPYDFSSIEADILGKTYENFIGHVIAGEKRLKEKESKGKRKEMGIYYTPAYIVDYIVRNSVGEYVKNKPFAFISKVSILDPACGSGSFLIKAFDVLVEECEKTCERKLNYGEKKSLMLNCIFGVDKDERAVDICKLNLSLKLAERGQKLPELHHNIKCGDSLIDDKEVAGYKAFKWEDEFKGIMADGGFDVVVGNPPYGADLNEKERLFLESKFKLGNTDTACLFMGLSPALMKKNGLNGFIVPKPFVYSSTWENIRKKLLEGIEEIVDCSKVWREVKLEQVIYFYKKDNLIRSYSSCVRKKEKIECIGEISKDTFKEFGFLLNGISEIELKIGRKIRNVGTCLNKLIINQRGAMYQKEIQEKSSDIGVLGGAQIGRYFIRNAVKGYIAKKFIKDDKAIIDKNSILVQNIVAHIENPKDHIKIIATLPKHINISSYIILDTINQLKNNSNFVPEVLISIINSKLMNWYAYRFIFGKAIRTMHFDNSITERIQIPKYIDNSNQQLLIKLADKMFSLNKKLQEEKISQLEKQKLEQEIKKTDKEIDELVYQIYGITEEEKKIIEESLK